MHIFMRVNEKFVTRNFFPQIWTQTNKNRLINSNVCTKMLSWDQGDFDMHVDSIHSVHRYLVCCL